MIANVFLIEKLLVQWLVSLKTTVAVLLLLICLLLLVVRIIFIVFFNSFFQAHCHENLSRQINFFLTN